MKTPASPTPPDSVVRSLRVLVTDDIDSSRLAMERLIADLGHQTLGVSDAAAMLDAVSTWQPDVVVLDLLMPHMDGFEATARLRELVNDRWLPVIVMSSLDGDEPFIHALSRGADDYLTRPINVDLLNAKLLHYQRVLQMQSQSRVLQERHTLMLTHMTDAVLSFDAQERVFELNWAAQALLGDDAVGKTVHQLLGTSYARLQADGELTLRTADGGQMPLGVTCSRWTHADQACVTLVMRDLTDQRRIERMKDEFLATVSHELRTPLTSIIGVLGLLSAGAAGALPEAAQGLASMAQRNGQRLSNLIDDVLDLTKLEGNRMPMQLRRSLLPELMQEALVANQGYADNYGVKLAIEVDEPQACALVDPERFLQIMANLLSNAIKHSPSQGVVTLRLQAQGREWRVAVQDQGRGIDPGFQARLFEKFEQADSSDRRSLGGTGLGLYISRLLIERMGGRIGADSVLGQGSTFWITLPAYNPQRRWALCVSQDSVWRDRAEAWVAPLIPLETATTADEAQDLLTRHGKPLVALADPGGQNDARGFVQQLQNLVPPGALMLMGTSVDQAFADAMGVPWLGAQERLLRGKTEQFVRQHIGA